MRYVHEYKNCLLVEQPNTDFAHIIVRQFYYDVYHLHLLQALTASTDKQISAIANKSLKEVKYHSRFSTQWLKRLGDGTEESHRRIQTALNDYWVYTGELCAPSPLDIAASEARYGSDLTAIQPLWENHISKILAKATLQQPEKGWMQSGGKTGEHTEYLGFILADMQFLQRAYPGAEW